MAGTPELDELYDASYRRLVVQLYAICGDLADAEEAVQEAFVSAIHKRREFRRVQNPEAWLRTAAINVLRGRWRHATVVLRYQPRVPGPQVPVEIGPEHVAVVSALAQVDRDLREVVVLYYLADRGTAEIARDLGIAEGTVKSRLSRARTKLAGLLNDRDEEHHV